MPGVPAPAGLLAALKLCAAGQSEPTPDPRLAAKAVPATLPAGSPGALQPGVLSEATIRVQRLARQEDHARAT
jgi:hypothetical protein